MKHILFAAIAIIIAAGVTSCRSRVPIQNIEHHVMPDEARQMSNEEIGRRIRQAIAPRGWYCNQLCDTQLTCANDNRGHKITIRIEYNQHDFSIYHVSTDNLSEKDGAVHPKYNKAIRYVERAILKAITKA